MKVIGQLVCGPNEIYLEDTLKEFERLCDDVVVATCNATNREKKLIKEYGYWQYEDNREWGRYQPLIKQDLVAKIQGLNPDWIIPLDADETVPTFTRDIFQGLVQDHKGRRALHLYVVNLWNDEIHYIRTGPAAPFWNVRAYNAAFAKGQPFLRKPVHCGNAPQICYTQPASRSYVPHILLHKGLMLPGRREEKAKRYDVYDPHGRHKGHEYYKFLRSSGTGTEYNQQEIVNKITAECKRVGAL